MPRAPWLSQGGGQFLMIEVLLWIIHGGFAGQVALAPPLPSKLGTCKPVKTGLWPWLSHFSGESPGNLSSCASSLGSV